MAVDTETKPGSLGVGPIEDSGVQDSAEGLDETAAPAPEGSSEAAAAPAPSSTETPVAGAPEAAPGAPPAPTGVPYAEYQRVLAEDSARDQVLLEELARMRNAEEERSQRDNWEQLGYTPEQIQEQLGHLRNYQAQAAAIAKERQDNARAVQTVAKEGNAKVEIALLFHETFGMPLKALMAFDNPKEMAAEAKAWALEQKVIKMQQAQVKPVVLANNRPGSVAPSSYETLRERKINGETLTKDELAVLYPGRY